MPDARLPYAAMKIQDGLVFVIGPDDERLCEVPRMAHPRDSKLRTERECWEIAQQLARLLNDESDSCHAAAEERSEA